MLSSFRRMSKSVVGTAVIIVIGLLVVAGFAIGDMQGLGVGNAGLGRTTLAEAGGMEVTDQDINSAMQRRLAQVREQNPEATYATIAGDFEPLLQNLINERALQAFAEKHGFVLSKRLIDAEIAEIPGVRGLSGQVTQESYQAFLDRQRMTDAELRQLVAGSLLQRLLVTPVASNPRVPVGMATPYASMLLEQRAGQVAFVPLAPFAAGLNPTDAQLQQFYAANRNRYMVPEQRVLNIAEIGPEQFNVEPTAQEIEAYYTANQDVYGAKDIRTLSQALVQDRQAADAIAQRARAGQSIAEAAKPAGLSAEDVSLGEQTREEFADIAGAEVASAAFSARPGTIVGPVQSPLGWHVIRIESARTQGGQSLAQARGEIAAAIRAEKRQTAIGEAIDRVQDTIDEGANFAEAARAANLGVVTTPAITATGAARGDPSYNLPERLMPAVRTGFDLTPGDEPVIEQLDEDRFALVAPAQVIPAAPAPLAQIREQVKQDWIGKRASDRAAAVAKAIAARATGETSLADAANAVEQPLPPVQPMRARRLQLTQAGADVPAPLRALFSTAEGKTQVGALEETPGFYVVKVNEIIPGNALNQPGLITSVQEQFQEPLSQEYGEQFVTAVRANVEVRRNEEAIAASRRRIIGGE